MNELIGDPVLLAPVIIILTLFGIGYVAAMVWSYNRDARKQGKQSGCLPMIVMLIGTVIAVMGSVLNAS